MYFQLTVKAGGATYRCNVERHVDEIYIIHPKKRHQSLESIFLTRAAGSWKGDAEDKSLVETIGSEIDKFLQNSGK